MITRCALLLFSISGALSLAVAEPVPVHLSTSVDSRYGRVPGFAVDGEENSYFASRLPAKTNDHFTVILETPRRLATLTVLSGQAEGGERLGNAVLEVSEDGTIFTELASLVEGKVTAEAPEKPLKALRVRVTADGRVPLVIRELRDSGGPFAPAGWVHLERKLGAEFGDTTIRFVGDASLLVGEEQKKLSEFLQKAAAIYGDQFAEMARRLQTPWEKIPKTLVVTYKADTGKGVPAYASGNSITLNSAWVLRDPADSAGMFTHELSHVVQQYPPGNPGWLVEGLSDLIRYELSPPTDAWVKRLERIDPKRSDYKHAYSEAAKFLAWVQKTHAPGLTGKLSRALFEKRYREELWTEWTGKDLATLWGEYQAG